MQQLNIDYKDFLRVVLEEDEKKHLYAACSAWYETPAGQFALQKLEDKISENLIEIFGYFALESGALLDSHQFLGESRVDTRFSLGRYAKTASIKADMEALPIDFDSVDLVIASHVLECSRDPHQVLREIDRVLVADGHCIFIGFNPLAFWHSRRSFCVSKETDQNPHLYGVSRVRDWLSLLDWKVNKISYASFRPTFMKGKIFDRLEKMEKWGSLYWPIFGNLYIIYAQKQVVGGILRKPQWQTSKVLTPDVVIPTTPSASTIPGSSQNRDRK